MYERIGNAHEIASHEKVSPKLNHHKGINLPENIVPYSEYWIIYNNEYAGFITLRHELNSFLKQRAGNIGYNIRPSMRGHGLAKKSLFLVLKKAKNTGLNKVFITCMETNIGSLKTILVAKKKFGGLESTKLTDKDGTFRRFWINTH